MDDALQAFRGSDKHDQEGQGMKFTLNIEPPTATAQEKQVRIVAGHPQFYEKPAAKQAKRILTAALMQHRPPKPFDGPVFLSVKWMFPKRKKDKFHGEIWKDTKPDTDNLQKGLKDCMTRCGYWKDDAQVVWEEAVKVWTSGEPGIVISIMEAEGGET